MTKADLIREKILINEELLELYFSTDVQYEEILKENEKLKKELDSIKQSLKEDSLEEMAFDRSTIIDKCVGKGKQFIKHFHKIYANPNDVNFNHWCQEMKNWFDDIKEYTLKPSNRKILDGELRDWFFTAGASYKNFIKDASESEIILYDKFCSKLISNKENFENAIKEIFNNYKNEV